MAAPRVRLGLWAAAAFLACRQAERRVGRGEETAISGLKGGRAGCDDNSRQRSPTSRARLCGKTCMQQGSPHLQRHLCCPLGFWDLGPQAHLILVGGGGSLGRLLLLVARLLSVARGSQEVGGGEVPARLVQRRVQCRVW
jgi:hypothetical protein